MPGLLGLDERPGVTLAAGASRSTDAVNVLAHVDGNIVRDDILDTRNVDSTGDQVRANEAGRRKNENSTLPDNYKLKTAD